jgi:superfamily II DNA or RNA helicase
MPTQFEEGMRLEARDQTWRLVRVQEFEACRLLTLEGHDRSNAGERLRLVEPFDRPRPIAALRLRKRSRRSAIASALAAIAAARPQRGLWTAAGATIELLPYQLEPALAVLGGATRVLLADAVGLGKTIQAGLILSELRERGWVERALIVCPAGLRDAWSQELRHRFNIAATVLDQIAIAGRIASLPPGVSPWSGHAVAIASIDFVKRPDIMASIDAEPVDLVIADEAHHLAPGTDRGAAVSRIAGRAPWCVFVSATPHSGDRAAFDYLTAMGSTGEPIAIFRRSRSDAGLPGSRRSHLLGVRPGAEEVALLAEVDRYVRAIWKARGREEPIVRLIAITMARRAASSTAAIARSVKRRRDLLAGAAPEAAQALLPWEEADDADDRDGDAILATPGHTSIEVERAMLDRLVALAERCRTSSKIERLDRLLALAREPAVVFTEFRDTLEAIVAALGPNRRVATLHGGLSADLRRRAIAAFNGGHADVLVATDAGGEGLNLHHRCRLVIDVELPWNPLRLEQRAGRVDRIGQERTVHAIRLFHPGTIEATVLDHLRLRHKRAQDALDRRVGEADIAAAVFDGSELAADSHGFIAGTAIGGGRAEAERIDWQRRALRVGSAATRSWARPRRRGSATMIALQHVTHLNDHGDLVGEAMHASCISLARQPEDHNRWRQLIEELGAATAPPPAIVVRHRSLQQRIERIRARFSRERAIRFQRSLFDGRADAAAARRAEIIAELDAALVRVLRTVTAPISLERGRASLIAMWPERRR